MLVVWKTRSQTTSKKTGGRGLKGYANHARRSNQDAEVQAAYALQLPAYGLSGPETLICPCNPLGCPTT